MKPLRYRISLGVAAAALLAAGGLAAPAYAQASFTDPDAGVACGAFERFGNGAWAATAPTMLNFDNGTSLAVRPGETFAPSRIIGGVEVSTVLDRHCGNS